MEHFFHFFSQTSFECNRKSPVVIVIFFVYFLYVHVMRALEVYLHKLQQF